VSRASDHAYEIIRSKILSGELPGGMQVVEEELSKMCGVSRTPVREALRRLESDLLVIRTNTKRSFIADWSLDDVADAYELRAELEGKAARRAAERMSDAALEQFRAIHRRIAAALGQSVPDVTGFLKGNREFHALILEVAGSRRLAALLGMLVEQPVVWRVVQHYSRDALNRSNADHQEMIAAFACRDGAWAEALMATHVLRSYRTYADSHCNLTDDVQQEAAE